MSSPLASVGRNVWSILAKSRKQTEQVVGKGEEWC